MISIQNCHNIKNINVHIVQEQINGQSTDKPLPDNQVRAFRKTAYHSSSNSLMLPPRVNINEKAKQLLKNSEVLNAYKNLPTQPQEPTKENMPPIQGLGGSRNQVKRDANILNMQRPIRPPSKRGRQESKAHLALKTLGAARTNSQTFHKPGRKLKPPTGVRMHKNFDSVDMRMTEPSQQSG